MKTINSINLKEFYEKFAEEYKFLYDNYDHVAGEDEAVDAFDEFLPKHKEFVREFDKYRGDLITSDREAAAFMFALYDIIDA